MFVDFEWPLVFMTPLSFLSLNQLWRRLSIFVDKIWIHYNEYSVESNHFIQDIKSDFLRSSAVICNSINGVSCLLILNRHWAWLTVILIQYRNVFFSSEFLCNSANCSGLVIRYRIGFLSSELLYCWWQLSYILTYKCFSLKWIALLTTFVRW